MSQHETTATDVAPSRPGAPAPGPASASDRGRRPRPPRRIESGTMVALVTKIVLLGLLDAVAAFAIVVMVGLDMWLPIVATVVATGLINWIYLGRGTRLPGKYLVPGVAFLLVFQVFVVLYSGYVAFTNYGDGHNGSKDDAIAAISRAGLDRVPDSPSYPVSVVEKDGELGLLGQAPDGDVVVGTSDEPLTVVDDPTLNSLGVPTGAPGWTTLSLSDVLGRQGEVVDLTVPLSEDPGDGFLRTDDASTAYVYRSAIVYDEATDTFTDGDGVVYTDDGEGEFASADGQVLRPGWKITVGFENFERAFSDPQISGPLLRVTVWTFAFAILSVATTFALGLFLATVLNHPRMRGVKVYRVLVILPYAFPAFLSGLVWAGLMNPEFGFINQVLLGGAEVPWLTDPWLARFSVLFVNLWLGYPYMFLVCTGALQSLPGELEEAARVDGAGPWTVFRSIKLPLLLVSTAPLLIASFAFNFNNFNVIYMLTRGWPRFDDTTLDIGSTDLLITMVYKIAFGSGGARDFGLASALSILIFLLVAAVSVVAFRRTKSLEEIN
ncbi:carbohydrate ABC transporter membrane protein 1 (CUT1 family) [Sediminihabitans luteus]|uniref:Maltose/maltodextrin transport system permease protein n=1 Tax=Sediminihabitans luteus TaxID=1138585 RepID=A0A2M9D1E8_9CELL|nr:ABC transporter permease subunit [Sediminihabitans luteus]PJJ77905.1 carbohydrate ABC transporter membrane protein 1 (CUT1 family) [Sediminihabitans luteus]GII99738.1 sugar ABC transporter permease [Sediminihabitans luteus]